MGTFLEEARQITTNDIKVILDDQTDLYTEEEIEMLKQELKDRQERAVEEMKKRLPASINCPKCEGLNESSNEICKFCGNRIDAMNICLKQVEQEEKEQSNVWMYVMSFLIPLIGIILGIVHIGKNENALGKSLLIFSVLMGFVYMVIWYLIFFSV